MIQLTFKTKKDRKKEITQQIYKDLAVKTDKAFANLFIFQWILAIGIALILSPKTWLGEVSQIHIHVFIAIFFGGVITAYPIYKIIKEPGSRFNGYIITISQMLFSILLIHLTGGRIETHFHVFGSLAFLAYYRDWKIIVLATLITSIDHIFRGLYFPLSVYGVDTADVWRAFEHTAWILFEDVFLIYSIKISVKATMAITEKRAELENTIKLVEEKSRAIEEHQMTINKQQEKLIESQQRCLTISSKMSAIGEMTSGIGHEINNPLSIICAYAQVVESQVDSGKASSEFIVGKMRQINNMALRIAKIVKGLRTVTRDSSTDPFTEENVVNIINDALEVVHLKFKTKGVVLNVPQYTNFQIQCNPGQITQVILNLLCNAVHAVATNHEKWVSLSVREDDNFAIIEVTDSGKGIPKEIADKIFQSFFTTKDPGKGTGLGLSISLEITRRHHGELFLDSQCENTKFVLKIPKKQAFEKRTETISCAS